MTAQKKKKLKKLIFPIGIFLLIFISESLIAMIGVNYYFYSSGKKHLAEIEIYTMNYSKTMAEAFARVAELSYRTNNYSSLTTLFHEKIQENTIDEAFFVLADGKLIAHSNTTLEKELQGNIANDEMSYNVDMILKPVNEKSDELFTGNYNIIWKQVPFKREIKALLQKYVYRDLKSTGWLFTKGVFSKEKVIGTVNFIISKERIYNSIQANINQARKYTILSILISLAISFLVSIVVLIRYRFIQKNAIETGIAPLPSDASIQIQPIDDEFHEPVLPDDWGTEIPDIELLSENISEQPVAHDNKNTNVVPLYEPAAASEKHTDESRDDEYITVELLGEIEDEPVPVKKHRPVPVQREYIAPVISIESLKKYKNREIRDAIPVARKR